MQDFLNEKRGKRLEKILILNVQKFSFNIKEQDKSSDIEQQPPFGDRKISNIQPQNRGGGGYTTNRNII